MILPDQARANSATKSAINILICFAILLALGGCIIPAFPRDPHREADGILESDEATRDELIELIGPPDFILDDSSYVWIASKTDAYLLLGYNLGGPLGEVHFVLAVDFGPTGVVAHYETHSKSGQDEFCLSNGICFTPTTHNVPLAPSSLDMRAKRFESDPVACVLYVYRDGEGIFSPSEDYAHINVSTESSDEDGEGKAAYLEHYSVASVP